MVKTTNPQSWSKIGQNWSSISLNIPLHGNWDNGAGTNVLETVPTQADGINKSSLMLVQFWYHRISISSHITAIPGGDGWG